VFHDIGLRRLRYTFRAANIFCDPWWRQICKLWWVVNLYWYTK